VEAFISNLVSTLPATSHHLTNLRNAQTRDDILSQVGQYYTNGQPEISLKGLLKKFWMVRNELSLYEGLLLRGHRIFIPSDLNKIFYTSYIMDTRALSSVTCVQKNLFGGQVHI